MRSRLTGGLLVMLAGVLGVSGCGSGDHYVVNRAENVYMKVPGEWTVLRAEIGASGASAPTLPWIVFFDRDGSPTVDHFEQGTTENPIGRIVVAALGGEDRDTMSLAGLRSFGLGGDPIEAASTEGSNVQVLGYDEDYIVDELHGNRIRFSFRGAEATDETVIEQVAVLDSARSRVYLLQVVCKAKCFQDNLSEITDVIQSLRITKEAR